MIKQNRQAMSNIIATVVLIGAAIAGGYGLYAATTENTNTQLSNDSLDIVSATIRNTYTESYLTVVVKNDGNAMLNNLNYTISGFSDSSTSTVDFTPSSLRTGSVTSITSVLSELIPEGQPMILTAAGTSDSGSYVQKTIEVRP